LQYFAQKKIRTCSLGVLDLRDLNSRLSATGEVSYGAEFRSFGIKYVDLNALLQMGKEESGVESLEITVEGKNRRILVELSNTVDYDNFFRVESDADKDWVLGRREEFATFFNNRGNLNWIARSFGFLPAMMAVISALSSITISILVTGQLGRFEYNATLFIALVVFLSSLWFSNSFSPPYVELDLKGDIKRKRFDLSDTILQLVIGLVASGIASVVALLYTSLTKH